jgi:hypothetical protein
MCTLRSSFKLGLHSVKTSWCHFVHVFGPTNGPKARCVQRPALYSVTIVENTETNWIASATVDRHGNPLARCVGPQTFAQRVWAAVSGFQLYKPLSRMYCTVSPGQRPRWHSLHLKRATCSISPARSEHWSGHCDIEFTVVSSTDLHSVFETLLLPCCPVGTTLSPCILRWRQRIMQGMMQLCHCVAPCVCAKPNPARTLVVQRGFLKQAIARIR